MAMRIGLSTATGETHSTAANSAREDVSSLPSGSATFHSVDSGQLDEITAAVLHYHPRADTSLIAKAFGAAARAHEGQRRKSGEPYFVHPIRVAMLIAELRLDVPSICAGLLHDCVEDTAMTVADIARDFSEEVAALVDGVTKISRLPWNTREERQAENFRKMLVAMAKDIRVILIKLADRMDNMRTLNHMSAEGQDRIARETIEIYAPLANRLGIYWLRAELEDLAFAYLQPNEYSQLVEKLRQHSTKRGEYVAEVEQILRALMDRNDLLCRVSGRSKNLWSIHSKIQRGDRTLDDICDVVAFRLVTSNIRDCYAALGVVHEHFTPVPGRFKDYVAMPKPNRYQSLHTSLIGPHGERMEIQIRTEEMHRICEQGIAAHWVYKEGGARLNQDDQSKFAWLRQLVEFQQDLKDPAEFIDAVRVDLFSDEVYVFTPQGEVHAFPAGATVIDFAFAIHSEVGMHCCGARVNGRMVPLRYRLENGDTVTIMTNENQKPSKSWLSLCATARARSKIRHSIRRERRERGLVLGREMLDRELRKHDLRLAAAEKNGGVERVVSALRTGSASELLLQIGFGKTTPSHVVSLLKDDRGSIADAAPNTLTRIFSKVRAKYSQSGIRVQGQGDVLVRFAHCCNALPGDAVTGFITRGRGVTVHKIDCSKALDLEPERRIEVTWDTDSDARYPATLTVDAVDKPGLLAEITKIFSDHSVSIQQATCNVVRNGRVIDTFRIRVKHVDDVRRLIRAILKIKGVYSADRG